MKRDVNEDARKVARDFWSRGMKSFGDMDILLQIDMCQTYGAYIERESNDYYKSHVKQWDQEIADLNKRNEDI